MLAAIRRCMSEALEASISSLTVGAGGGGSLGRQARPASAVKAAAVAVEHQLALVAPQEVSGKIHVASQSDES